MKRILIGLLLTGLMAINCFSAAVFTGTGSDIMYAYPYGQLLGSEYSAVVFTDRYVGNITPKAIFSLGALAGVGGEALILYYDMTRTFATSRGSISMQVETAGGGSYFMMDVPANTLVASRNCVAINVNLNDTVNYPQFSRARMYLNGKRVVSTGQYDAGGWATPAPLDAVVIGRNSWTGTSIFSGAVEMLLIYKRNLTPQEIQDIYGTNGAKYPKNGLLGCWELNGSEVFDSVSSANVAGSGSAGRALVGMTRFVGSGIKSKARSY